MQSTPTAREADPHDMFVIEPDVVLAARADAPDPHRREPNLRALVSEISAGVAAQAAAPKVDTSFRAAAVGKKRGKWAGRFIAAFMFALLSAVGAAAWQRYGDTAQAYVATVAPLLGLAPSQAVSVPPPAVAAASPDQIAAPADAAAPPADTVVASAPAAGDQTQIVEQLTGDLAAMGQQVEQLKASIAELKAGQDQLTRDVKVTETKAAEAKAFEQNMRAKVSALPPRPPVVKKPKPYVSPPVQASAAPPLPPPGAPGSAPVQVAPAPPPAPPVSAAPQDDVPRPPMPVR